MGFEGLDLTGFGAFPAVRLHHGSYNTKDGMNLGTEFYGFIQDGGTKRKFVYTNGLDERDPQKDFFFTYDQIYTTSGDTVNEVLQDWKSRGWNHDVSPYLDVMIQVYGGEHNGTLIILAVPKTSISRLSVHIGKIFMENKVPSEVVTKFGIAAEIAKGATSFTPMEFSVWNG